MTMESYEFYKNGAIQSQKMIDSIEKEIYNLKDLLEAKQDELAYYREHLRNCNQAMQEIRQ